MHFSPLRFMEIIVLSMVSMNTIIADGETRANRNMNELEAEKLGL